MHAAWKLVLRCPRVSARLVLRRRRGKIPASPGPSSLPGRHAIGQLRDSRRPPATFPGDHPAARRQPVRRPSHGRELALIHLPPAGHLRDARRHAGHLCAARRMIVRSPDPPTARRPPARRPAATCDLSRRSICRAPPARPRADCACAAWKVNPKL